MGSNDTDRFMSLSTTACVAQLIRNEVFFEIKDFFEREGYVHVEPPILHESIPNKKAEIYLSVDNEAYSLNSSNALYMTAFAAKFNRVYAISSTFRRENESKNHLLEFKMLEAEMVGVDFDEMMDFIISLIKSILFGICNGVRLREYPNVKKRSLQLLEQFDPVIVTYEELNKNLLTKTGSSILNYSDISDIDYLISGFIERPTIIIDYPTRLASWTAKPKTNGVSYALNLLLPDTYGELCEGCERISNYRYFEKKFKVANITNLDWYTSAVKQINEKRCGFGIGIDRLVRWILGAKQIEDTLFFPRKKSED